MTIDERHRRRAVEETHRSFAVEASAGTGKTTTLVSRVLHLVLEKGPGGQPLPISKICAITFTEKAAGEMKIRLRQELERVVRLNKDKEALAQNALRELDAAAISTFHAFAVSLLKERPVEAGLDPRFTALDELQGKFFFLEVWEPWIHRALMERRRVLEDALRQGIALDQVRDLADTLRHHAWPVRNLSLVPPLSDAQVAEQRALLLQESSKFPDLLKDPTDLLAGPLDQAIAWLSDPAGSEDPTGPGRGGRAASWRGGRETVEEVKAFLRRVEQLGMLCSRLPRQRILDALARWLIGEFLSEWDARKRMRGYLDFDDQLSAARQLLVTSRSARAEFQKRYETLLVDEFQDTDPVQLEIVLLLSSTDLEEKMPSRLKPEPGRLFIVGDPKQAIYRFRGADIETYLETMERAKTEGGGLERLELTTNFRSVPSILRFVDAAFVGVMQQEGLYQSDYLAFGEGGKRTEEPASPSVYILGDRCGDGRLAGEGKEFIRLEAKRTAGLIARMVGSENWRIEDHSREGASWRRPGYGDIAVLLPVLSRVEELERELRDAGVPYVLEGGKFYYARSEVASAVSALRTVSNPNDQVALYSALRSVFFGMSDEDLLRARLGGIPLDYRTEVPRESPLHRPYAILHQLHLQRHERSASATMEVLLRETGAREVLAMRGLQSVANLGKLVRQLRSLQERATFSEVVSLLGTIDEEELAESESRLMEERSDAVRILTIHKAKGLDFPIVIVAGAGLERGQHGLDFLADGHERKQFALKLGAIKDGWMTPAWDELKEGEKKREEAELIRLLYVALTRARDHLVISTHNKGTVEKDTGLLAASLAKTRLAPLAGFLENRLDNEPELARFLETSAVDSVTEPAGAKTETVGLKWDAILKREYAELEDLVTRTPQSRVLQSASHAGEGWQAEEPEADTARSRGIRLGVAFHEVMESVDFQHPESISAKAARAAARHGLSRESLEELEAMLRNCVRSQLIERLVRGGGKSWRELPYLRPLQPAQGIEEGKIDLMFEESDGWILVDYKTDRIPEDPGQIVSFFRDKYSAQIRHYVDAVLALGLRVKAAYLLLARTGSHIPLLD